MICKYFIPSVLLPHLLSFVFSMMPSALRNNSTHFCLITNSSNYLPELTPHTRPESLGSSLKHVSHEPGVSDMPWTPGYSWVSASFPPPFSPGWLVHGYSVCLSWPVCLLTFLILLLGATKSCRPSCEISHQYFGTEHEIMIFQDCDWPPNSNTNFSFFQQKFQLLLRIYLLPILVRVSPCSKC